ncbi:MAG TPA: glycosyltransferase family 4 protein [Candidatus Angelobacter sp.]|nr:glycosyltransferase family 4 protein [Candidatus Angelobacter sp.]
MQIAILGRNVQPPWNEAVKNMAYELSRQLAIMGHTVRLLTTKGEEVVVEDGVELCPIPRGRFGKMALKMLLELEKAGRLDLIHVQNLIIHRSLAPTLWNLRRKSKLPIVAYCCQLPSLSISHWLEVLRTDPWEAASTKLGMLAPAGATNWALRKVSQIVASSNFVKTRLEASRPSKEIQIVPPFVRTDWLTAKVKTPKDSQGSPTILYLGSHKALRGEGDFLKMLALVRQEMGEVRGVAVTTFPIPRRINALLKNLGLGDSVKFLSRNVDLDVPGLIQSSNLYVSTGLSPIGSIDPPLTLIEAQILGTPVLSYDTGGISEVLDENELVKYRDYTGLAKLAIETLKRNGAKNPRLDLLSRFGSQAAAKHFEGIYQNLM